LSEVILEDEKKKIPANKTPKWMTEEQYEALKEYNKNLLEERKNGQIKR
jgi:hypothetical protein